MHTSIPKKRTVSVFDLHKGKIFFDGIYCSIATAIVDKHRI
ncbi:hypothetical protein RR42_s2600 [Cupriavidus basilensis]|uniref:Uncharacterized protein n=1 Tax=Cupriavidus basilensis TaxID=68895 RepID=A0A0C4YEP3_9BURK|nr:hypothetical protein RR42_s2600 [Cupriavidus basilensis]